MVNKNTLYIATIFFFIWDNLTLQNESFRQSKICINLKVNPKIRFYFAIALEFGFKFEILEYEPFVDELPPWGGITAEDCSVWSWWVHDGGGGARGSSVDPGHSRIGGI